MAPARTASSASLADARWKRPHRGAHGDTRRQREELLAVPASQVGNRTKHALAPEVLIGKGRDVAHVDAGADDYPALGHSPQRLRHEGTGRGEDDGRIQLRRR